MASTRKRSTGPRSRAATTAADPQYSVVYIHGIGAKPRPSVLKRQWDEALFGRDLGGGSRLAYWADLLHPVPLGPEDDELGAEDPRTIGLATAHLAGAGGVEGVEPLGPAARDYARAIQTRMLAPLAAPRGPRGKVLPGPLRPIATALLTRLFIHDTAAYFYDETLRGAMRERLRAILRVPRGPTVLVAHSQGTMIAYDVLHELGAAAGDIVAFVTLGSPLGIEEVKDQVHRPHRVPPACARWLNFADPVDPVALDTGLASDYAPASRITDTRVTNPDRQRLLGYNPHSALGYLRTAEVRAAVRALLPSDILTVANRHAISKEVARGMADAAQRIHVLIELDEKLPGYTLGEKAAELERSLREITAQAPAAEVDRLRHYVAANLTAGELERLAARHRSLAVHRVWRNARKRALVTAAARAMQVNTARAGYEARGAGIGWAVLDTGVAADHPHFAHDTRGARRGARIAAAWDCTRAGAPRAGAEDGNGHGTHVAGIIAGQGPESDRDPESPVHYGLAPLADLHVYKVLADDGDGRDSWIIKALDHIATVNENAASLVIHGVNLSLGGAFDYESYACGHSPLCKELRRLWRQGAVVCVAAGNEGLLSVAGAGGFETLNLDLSIGDPANLEESIAVGSVHKEQPRRYGISFFSSRGPTADGRPKPDVVAPGEKIVSANHAWRKRGAARYVAMDGTSMACPGVSGLIAAFLSVRREYLGYPEEVKRLLLASCTDLGRDRYHQGAGLPNLVRMLTAT